MSENEKTEHGWSEDTEVVLGCLILGTAFGFIVGAMFVLSIIGLWSLFT